MISISEIKEGDRLSGTVFRCPGCDKLHLAKGGTKYCSGTCRMRAVRGRESAVESQSTP